MEEYGPVYVLLLFIPLIFLVIFKHLKTFRTKSSSLPPGPFPWLLLGNVHQIGEKPHIALASLAKRYGPIFSVKLGTQLMIVGSSPKAAREILTTHDQVLTGRYIPHIVPVKASKSINGVSLVWALECNEAWKKFRSITRSELFSNNALEVQASLREEKVMKMVKVIKKMEGRAVKIADLLFAFFFNSLGKILLSRDFISEEDDDGVEGEMKRIFCEVMEIAAAPNISDLFPIVGRFDLQGLKRKADEQFKKVSAMWEPVMKERREQRDSPDSRQADFLDVLISNGFSDAVINEFFLEMLLAGVDTPTSTIEWAMTELLINPGCMTRVQEELATEINQNMMKESHLTQLPYLRACIKETLRLHPPTPLLLPRRAIETCEVMGYTVPKDARVAVNVWAIGRDPKVWDEPLAFRPEKFLNTTTDFKGNDDFEFLAFGGGRRICPAIPMAARELPHILASLLHFFDWSLPQGVDGTNIDMSEKFGITLHKEQPLLLVPKSRRTII